MRNSTARPTSRANRLGVTVRRIALPALALALVSPVTSPKAPVQAQPRTFEPFVLDWSSTEAFPTASVAWGDYDGDGDLDLAVGNYERPNQVYQNDDGRLSLVWESAPEAEGGGHDRTFSVAWGDYDGDGDLDLLAGNGCDIFNTSFSPVGQQERLYHNAGGALRAEAVLALPARDCTTSVAWGDYDNDGRPDLAVGNGAVLRDPFGVKDASLPIGEPERIYRNLTGADGVPRFQQVWQSTPNLSASDPTQGVAWGDYNGDGLLDLAVANLALPEEICRDYLLIPRYCGDLSRVYANTTPAGQNNRASFVPAWAADERALTFAVAWGDVDGDGRLDLALGNANVSIERFPLPVVPNRVYLNSGGTLTRDLRWQPGRPPGVDPGQVTTLSLAWADYDGDGNLDLATGTVGAAGADFVGGENQLFRNEGTGLADTPLWESPQTDDTISVAWGDLDGDGRPDLATGNSGLLFRAGVSGQPNRVYRNRIPALERAPSWTAAPDDPTSAVAWGDVDGDRDLDLVVANAVFADVPDQTVPAGRLYRNTGGRLAADPGWQPAPAPALAVALSDSDGDGDLDITIGHACEAFAPDCRSVEIYRNQGQQFESAPAWRSAEKDPITALAWSDLDSDGDLDLAVSSLQGPSRLYRNTGGVLTLDEDWRPPPSNGLSLAWADVDRDSDPDLAIGVGCTPAQSRCAGVELYLNEAGTLAAVPAFSAGATDYTTSLAWGDLDDDGDLDLAAGNSGQPVRLYRNCTLRREADGCGPNDALLSQAPVWSSVNADVTQSVAWGDLDNDGDLDLAVGNYGFEAGAVTPQANRIYSNLNGALTADAVWTASDRSVTTSVAWADLDGDGSLELVAAGKFIADGIENEGPGVRVYRNLRINPRTQENVPLVRIDPPIAVPTVPSAGRYAVASIIASSEVTFTYTLTHPRSVPVRRVRAQFSLDGDGAWQEAVPAAWSRTENLSTSPEGVEHQFVWDLFHSGVMGLSDNVVVRLVAIPAVAAQPPYVNRTPERFIVGASSATTTPFRLRGTQVRVLDEAGTPVEGALVYRIPAGQKGGGQPLVDSLARPFRTDALGYLQGSAKVSPGDRLVALAPISSTDSFTVYATSAAPTANGLEPAPVSAPGVQELRVSAGNPLMLLHLNLSLEWDGRNDRAYLGQLRAAIQRASELLYDLSEGQAALGAVTIYHGRDQWDTAHMRVYATNRLRPSAVKGGIVSSVITDPLSLQPQPLLPPLTYEPGQIRMGTVWNRYGGAIGEIGDDWARTLAHELGHFAFFLDDNYLGLDDQRRLVTIESCRGMMADPYIDDNTEFVPPRSWLPGCARTLSNQATRIVGRDGSVVAEGRSDWETIATFYPWLKRPTTEFEGLTSGPALLPLAVTQIGERFPPLETNGPAPQETFAVSLRKADGGYYQASGNARAILFQSERLIDLGRPALDQIVVRGGREGDRLCLYDPPGAHQGCTQLTAGNQALTVAPARDWQPDIVVSPITSRTVSINVLGVAPGADLRVRLYPTNSSAAPSVEQQLAPSGAIYKATVTLDQPSFEGYVHLWEAAQLGRREAIADYLLGGNPGRKWAGFAPRGSPGRKWAGFAPVLSSDGQVIIYDRGLVFEEDSFIAIQSATRVRAAPAWTVPVGKTYRLTRSPRAPEDLSQASINISYFEQDLPPGTESGIAVYFFDEQDSSWERLETDLNMLRNEASAQVRGVGLYTLMTSPHVDVGWNLLSYPWPQATTVREALRLINAEGAYTTVYGYSPPNGADPWQVFDIDAPAWVNDLDPPAGSARPALVYGQGYWVRATIGALRPVRTASLPTSLPTPPATYYAVLPAGGAGIDAGNPVIARIGDTICGSTTTRRVGEELVFVIDVAAAASDQLRACGVPGRSVSVEVAGLAGTATVEWQNERPARLWWGASEPPARARLFLPLLR